MVRFCGIFILLVNKNLMEDAMAQCKQCGTKGLFLRINTHGLCETCNNALEREHVKKQKNKKDNEKKRREKDKKRIGLLTSK